MKILQIGKFYHPDVGGMETMLRSLAEGLEERGHEVTVLCASGTARSSDERIAGVRVFRAGSLGSLLSQPLAPALPFAIARLAREAELVHVHTPHPLAETALVALPPGPPLVTTYHSDVVRQKALAPLVTRITRSLLSRSAAIAVASENIMRSSRLLASFGARARVIPMGIDPRRFELSPAIASRAKTLVETEGRFLLFVGRLVGYKGLSYLISAMRHVDARLVVVGDGPLGHRLLSQARREGVSGRVAFRGRVADPVELAAHYHACEAVVLPSVSRAEAFGLVQLEAMACGRPTVTTRIDTGVLDVHEEGVTGLVVEPESPASLARAANSLLSDPSRRLAMGEAARRRFLERFTRDRMVDAYVELYDEVAGKKG